MTGNWTRWMGTQPGVINLMPLLPLLPTNGKPLQRWSIMHELVSYLIGLLIHEERPRNQLNTSLLFLDKKRETFFLPPIFLSLSLHIGHNQFHIIYHTQGQVKQQKSLGMEKNVDL